jgi:putative ABC transport system permease protein
VGQFVELPIPSGMARLRIAAVYRDYASERGSLALSRASFVRHFGETSPIGLGLYTQPATDKALALQRIRDACRAYPVRLQSRTEVLEQSLAVFDRTFAVTDILRFVALGVAVIGLVSALLAQQFERLREYGTLRALGFGAGDIVRVVIAQTALLGLVAATAAIPLGLVVGLVLIEVINLRSFGWTMSIAVPWPALASTWILSVGAALLAGLYPAWQAVRQAPAVAMRDE